MTVDVACHTSTKQTQSHHVWFKRSNHIHDCVNILAESLRVYLTTPLSNGGSAWRLGGVALPPVKFPKQVGDFNLVGEHIKCLHHVPKKNNNVHTTAKKVVEEPVLGGIGVISHVVGVLNLCGDGVEIGSGEFVTLLLLV